MTPLLAVEDLEVRYGQGRAGATVLHRVMLTVNMGESLAVVGASGSGKTTLARAIAGLVKPSAGRILWQGTDITHMSFAERRRGRVAIAMVFQDPQSSLAVHWLFANGLRTCWQPLHYRVIAWIAFRTRCRAASVRGSRLPERCVPILNCSSWTSLLLHWT